MIQFTMLDKRMTMENLGLIPYFLDADNPASASTQFNKAYVSGWSPFQGFKLLPNNVLTYPGDPPTHPLAVAHLRDELIVFYEHAWVAIIQPDRSFEVCRMD